MPDLHIDDEHLDQYASGTLPEEHLAGVEEHLLSCKACQSRLDSSDEFAMLFRVAAVQPDARSQRSWRLFWNHRVTGWTAAAAAALAILLSVVGPFRKPPTAPATVVMQSLRGPDAPAQVTAGRPAWLVFDIVPTAGVNVYEARIVNPLGIEILRAEVSSKDGHLAALVDRLPPGSYWVRVSRSDNREPIAEYGLRAK
ncbi:MAG: zf-HC2 domain-containing protein [Acidobacteriia bacterium]|nr:zf-HC2 domain-containing protein [Terriglobia bacterium]